MVYVPAPLRPLYHLLALKRRVLRRPESPVALLCRMTRPQEGADAREGL